MSQDKTRKKDTTITNTKRPINRAEYRAKSKLIKTYSESKRALILINSNTMFAAHDAECKASRDRLYSAYWAKIAEIEVYCVAQQEAIDAEYNARKRPNDKSTQPQP